MGDGNIGQFLEHAFVLGIGGKESGVAGFHPSPGAGDDSGLVANDDNLAPGDHIGISSAKFVGGFRVGDNLQAALGDGKRSGILAGVDALTGDGNGGGADIGVVSVGNIIVGSGHSSAVDGDSNGGHLCQCGVGILGVFQDDFRILQVSALADGDIFNSSDCTGVYQFAAGIVDVVVLNQAILQGRRSAPQGAEFAAADRLGAVTRNV